MIELQSSPIPVQNSPCDLRVTEAPTENVHSLDTPPLQHGWFEEWHVVWVCGQVETLEDFFNSLDQFCWLWNPGPTVLSGVPFCGIWWLNPTELVSILELLQVMLIHNRKGSREELTEGAVDGMML